MKWLKKIWWEIRIELRGLFLSLVCWLPTQPGMRLRVRILRRYLAGIGTDAVIQPGLRFTSPEKISIGSNGNLARNVFITGGGGVRIGDWVGFGPDVKVWSVNHRFDDPDRPWLLQGWDHQEVVIEDDVWLGAAVFVMPGVTIGRGAIVSACAVVSKSIPPYAIVAGNPGRIIGWRKRKQPLDPAKDQSRETAAADSEAGK